MILHDRYKNSVFGRKTEVLWVVSFTSACFVTDWMTTFLLVRSFSFHNYMNDRSDRSIRLILLNEQNY